MKIQRPLLLLIILLSIALLSLAAGLVLKSVQTGTAGKTYVAEPMQKATVVRLVAEESSGVTAVLERFVPLIRQELNIILEINSVPFADKYNILADEIFYKSDNYDLYVIWPIHLADFAPHLTDLASIVPGKSGQVKRDLNIEDNIPEYRWTTEYKGRIYGIQIDGDIKLLHYRWDLANDPDIKQTFLERYGYELDMNRLSWNNYSDIAEFFTDPDKDFYGTIEIATLFSAFTFLDRYIGMGGELFSPDDMTPFPDRDIALKAIVHGLETFENYMPPGASGFYAEEVFDHFLFNPHVFMMPYWPDAWRASVDDRRSGVERKIAVAQMPGFYSDGQLVRNPDMNGGRIIVMSDRCRESEAAYKVLAFFSRQDISEYLVKSGHSWLDPWKQSQLRKEFFIDEYPDLNGLTSLYIETIKESIRNGHPGLQIYGSVHYYSLIEKWVPAVWRKAVTPEYGLEMIVSGFDDITQSLGRNRLRDDFNYYERNVLNAVR